ncbi:MULTISPECIES: hypothetical protein [Paenibacillus]|uniref:hypothetical protein n=1 Tax=Paenibacillus TaxID=44249 RepID=UPI00096D0E51|nr:MULTISPECIES: hypothetical protein [Paenibacillus]OMF48603.1 hypothetical protein BK135_09920 [Paenibacillus peoriae]QYK61840.1 hypothetical protein KAI37_02164 [Paenibacillus sp. S25]
MGQTVKLYKWENYEAVKGWDQRHGFALVGDMLSFNFVGGTSQPEEYILPEGYTYEEDSNLFGQVIWDDEGGKCEIGYERGKPVLISTKLAVLKKK